MTMPIREPLHLSIATTHYGPGFAYELRLIKAGLLYADKATIYSFPLSSIALLILTIRDSKLEAAQVADLLSIVAQHGKGREIPIALLMRQAEEIERALNSGLLQQGFAQLGLESLINTINSAKTFIQSGYHDFDEILLRKLPELEEYRAAVFAQADKAYSNLILDTLANGATYPLFDQDLVEKFPHHFQQTYSNNTNAATKPNDARSPTLSDETLKNARETKLAADLFSRLPTFESATVDEILDIRRELDRPLAGFRSEVIKLAEQISSEPWDKDFPHEAGRLIRRDIEPAILHLEDEVKSNRFLTKLAYESPQIPLEVGRDTILGFALGSLGGAATSLLGAATGAGVAAVKVYREWKEKKKEIERNQLYFYYEAGQRLKRGPRKRPRRFGRGR